MPNWEPISADDVLTSAEFAHIYKVTESSVKAAVIRGELPGIKIGPYVRVFTAATRFVPMPDPQEEAI